MPKHFIDGFRSMAGAILLIALAPLSAGAQDQADGEQVLLELRQLRSEVDFLRNQVETGGGVADVRFNDLQRRLDKVLDDAASLATQASTAQRRAEAAVRKVDLLERQVSVMEAAMDVMATRLARLEEDALFNDASDPVTPATEPEPIAEAESETLEAIVEGDDGSVPLPKDRTDTLPPAREVVVEVAIEAEEIIEEPDRPARGLIAVEGAKPLVGEIPVLPLPRPGPPTRGNATALAETGTLGDEEPADQGASTSGFDAAKADYDAGSFTEAAEALLLMIDTDTLGAREAEGFYLLGTALLRSEEYAASVQALAQGLRRFPDSAFSAPSLVNLADALRGNDQQDEACRLLSFVPLEYPENATAIANAKDRSDAFGC